MATKAPEKSVEVNDSSERDGGAAGNYDDDKIRSCCQLLNPATEDQTGVVYCSKQRTPSELIIAKLVICWRTYEEKFRNKGWTAQDSITENKLQALLEMQKLTTINGGFIKFEEAFEIYGAHNHGYPDKRTFINAVSSEDIGLNIHIIQVVTATSDPIRYIVEKNQGLNLNAEKLLQSIAKEQNKPRAERQHIDQELFQDILSTVDSEWDKLCLQSPVFMQSH